MSVHLSAVSCSSSFTNEIIATGLPKNVQYGKWVTGFVWGNTSNMAQVTVSPNGELIANAGGSLTGLFISYDYITSD